jgi:2,4-dienoyl-CoA reductase-like NADH-dependent reductase (Old Yellow Enzyme family)
MVRYPHVQRPIVINGVAIRNRIFMPAHTTNFGEHHLPSQRHVDYHRERAKGGVGAIIFEAVRVTKNTLGRPQGVAGFLPGCVEAFRRVADATHEHGVPLIGQVCHMGRQIEGEFERSCSVGASPIRWSTTAFPPREMSRRDMDIVVDGFVRTSLNLLEAGLDGLEIHWGHGHLLQQFLSPSSNHRTDAYGGTIEGRMRFPLEVLLAVRRAIGPSRCMGIRFSAEEFLPDGINPVMSVEILERALREVQIDFIHVTHSAYNMAYSIGTQMADMGFDKADVRHLSGQIRRGLRAASRNVPVLTVCKYRDLAEAEAMIAAGEADMVGMARAHIADPAIVRKSIEGREKDVRRCLACNQGCAQHLERNIAITCLVNPIAGREATWAEPGAISLGSKRRVLVIGGGPAGCEAAYVAAADGHQVSIWERGDRLGGRLALAPLMEKRGDFQSLLDLQRYRLEMLSVPVEFERNATAAEIAAHKPDFVILATGSTPSEFVFPSGRRGVTLDQAVERPELLGKMVIVHDDTGDWPAFSLLEHLALRGHRVIALSPLAGIGWRTTIYSTAATRKRLRSLNVRIVPLRGLVDFDGETLHTEDLSTGEADHFTAVNTVVVVRTAVVNNPLETKLEQAGIPYIMAGDCLAPRTALEAIFEGHAAGRAAGERP